MPDFPKIEEEAPRPSVLSANASLYPDKIIIGTVDKVKDFGGISSTNITKLPVDSKSELIGSTVRKHLALTEYILKPENHKMYYTAFLSAIGFKNAKEYHRNAKYLSIYQKDEEIIISPTRNEKKSFVRTKDLPSFHVSISATDHELGEQIKEAWLKCIDNSV